RTRSCSPLRFGNRPAPWRWRDLLLTLQPRGIMLLFSCCCVVVLPCVGQISQTVKGVSNNLLNIFEHFFPPVSRSVSGWIRQSWMPIKPQATWPFGGDMSTVGAAPKWYNWRTERRLQPASTFLCRTRPGSLKAAFHERGHYQTESSVDVRYAQVQ